MTLYTEKIVKKRTTISFVEFQLFSKQIYLRNSDSKFFCLILIYLFFFSLLFTQKFIDMKDTAVKRNFLLGYVKM